MKIIQRLAGLLRNPWPARPGRPIDRAYPSHRRNRHAGHDGSAMGEHCTGKSPEDARYYRTHCITEFARKPFLPSGFAGLGGCRC